MGARLTGEALEALAAGHGLLSDDAAVFGFSYLADVPPIWVDDDAEVSRRINAKRNDDLAADVWWRVNEVARICRDLTCRPRSRDGRDLCYVSRALAEAKQVARMLPWPRPIYCAVPDPLSESLAVIATAGPRRDLLDAAASRLCAALDDGGWVDPVVLAGWVDDAVLALCGYGAGLLTCAG